MCTGIKHCVCGREKACSSSKCSCQIHHFRSLRIDTSTFCAVATLFCVGLDIVQASILQCLLELTVDLYSNQMSTDNVFSFVRCLHLMHSPQRALRKSYSPYEELHGKDFCGHNSDLNPWNSSPWEECCVKSPNNLQLCFIWHRSEHQHRRTFMRKWGSCQHRSKEQRDSSCFKLQTDSG